ncbi:MAG: helix-turn-helix domain-containing protein [Dehalococcoidales bacterium]|nr:helix-turn-helix domain-containing protein [Dehalococcoidales bacterium]
MVDEETLVSISEASRILGVSEPALRQWTDEGKIKAFITPGGHRRYSKAELKKLINSQQKMLGVKDLALRLESTVQVHREIDKAFLNTTLWYSRLSEESQIHLASLGRRLLSLIIRYVSEPPRRKETIQMARDVGRDFGETLARLELPLTDSLQAFLLHREPVMSMATSLLKKRQASERIAGAIPRADHIIDEALVALVSAHQQYRMSQQGTKGGVG